MNLFLDEGYVRQSLELHLFFARIMKEHSLFLAAGFTPANKDFAKRALFFKDEFEKILSEALTLANGRISCGVLSSCEIVTEFTGKAEMQTEKFTGIPIDTRLTERACALRCEDNIRPSSSVAHRVMTLNRNALKCVKGLIALKEETLEKALCCEMFTANYPLLLEHILREARLYCELIEGIENGTANCNTIQNDEMFWNRIMMEHALFIRGLLDPTECELIDEADCFAKEFNELLCKANEKGLTADSLAETIKIRDFKAAGAKGIERCKIKSIILPLLADHVLREANHYIRLLKMN